MKAAGLSAHQVLAPLMLTGLVVAVISFGFNERVVARATATLAQMGFEGDPRLRGAATAGQQQTHAEHDQQQGTGHLPLQT